MTSSGVKQTYIQGAKITDEIMHHVPNSGGVTVGIYGSKGSGKTTFLLTLAQNITCIDPVSGKLEAETIVWRGRSNDYWNWIPKEKVVLFVHKKDYDRVLFKDDILNIIPRKDLPLIEPYVSIKQLNTRLRAGKINVVYEPTQYQIPERIIKIIQKRGGSDVKITKKADPVIFWFEFMDWMVHNKNPKFMTVIFDEADELFMASPSSERWHLNLWAKDVIKDLRRRRISLFLACHGYTDLDGRIKSKIQYKVWMRGSVTMPESLVNRLSPLLLEPGVYYIERTGWGKAHFPKIPEKSIIITYTDGVDERDDFGEGEEPDMTDINNIPTPKKKATQPNNIISPTQLPEECLIRDSLGNITSIDISKLLQPSTNPNITVKKKKPAHKNPMVHKKSYIKERTTTNDNKVEVAKVYDKKIESGEVEEVRVPKIERNDLTTDEVDK